jgi:guanylate cyclase soluble subunit beta
MYGLINNALKGMITEDFGDDRWKNILEKSGVPDDSFMTMKSYDDTITYSLVGAAAEVLGAPPETCLEIFGVYWIKKTAVESYGQLMDTAGSDMIEFLGNLNSMHDRIASTFLDYVPPYFRIEEIEPGYYDLHYISSREGLVPFVRGLLRGLAEKFNQRTKVISETELPVDSGCHCVFRLEISSV